MNEVSKSQFDWPHFSFLIISNNYKHCLLQRTLWSG